MNRNWKRTLLANCKQPFFVCFALAVLGTPGDSNNELAAQLKGGRRSASGNLQITSRLPPLWRALRSARPPVNTTSTSFSTPGLCPRRILHGRHFLSWKGILRQQALQRLEGHISYSFTNSLWASLDTRYCFRGSTSSTA